MVEKINKQYGNIEENILAQKYDNFVKERLKSKIEPYLQTNNINKVDVLQRIVEIQDLYIEMFDIQYEISRISPRNKVLKYIENGTNTEIEVFAFAIDDQAKSWLNRLSSTLSILMIKASEFNEINARRRDYRILAASIFISALIGVLTTWSFDKENDKDFINKTVEIKRYQDSITNEMLHEYILNFESLKLLHKSPIDSIINNKNDKGIK